MTEKASEIFVHSREASLDEAAERALAGEEIFGDNFTLDQICRWYAEEERGYFDVSAAAGGHVATYAAFDRYHFFDHVTVGGKVLGIGVADGTDFLPVVHAVEEFHFLEICEDFWTEEVAGTPAFYSKPSVGGEIAYADDSFDVGAFFSVLHHIPNVSFTIQEMYRVLKPGGVLLMREPTVSMGDWRQPRKGLTRNERGLPLDALRKAVVAAGFAIEREVRCVHPIIRRLAGLAGEKRPYNYRFPTLIDAWMSKFLKLGDRYHPVSFRDRIQPQGVAMILRKPDGARL